MSYPIVDITGKIFGNLKVIKRLDFKINNKIAWLCLCKCGNLTQREGTSMKSGNTKSCGSCRPRDKYPSEYSSWACMQNRCYNKNNVDYSRYGGRGITVCSRWSDFWLFLEDLGLKEFSSLTIDRIDNESNYKLSNCKWSTRYEQANNRSTPILNPPIIKNI